MSSRDRPTREVIRLRRVLAEQKSSTSRTRSGGATRCGSEGAAISAPGEFIGSVDTITFSDRKAPMPSAGHGRVTAAR